MGAEKIGKYLIAEERQIPGRTTPVWDIYSTEDGTEIGGVRWWGAWRQYVFQPNQHTIFHNGCLRDIAAFLDRCNAAHRAKAAERRGKRGLND